MSRWIKPLVLTLLLGPMASGHANGAESAVVHVVLVWLKESANAEHRDRIVEATRGFASIPGVEEVRVGEPLVSERPTVDDSFDVGLYMVFSSKDALDRYLVHPDHRAAQEQVLRPLVRKVVVYDFVDGGS